MQAFDVNAMPQFDEDLQQINQQKAHQDEIVDFDPRFIYFKTGNNYRVRLGWPVDPNGARKSPFIFKNVHRDFGQGRSGDEVVCPTSDYIFGKAGFKACPVCAELSRLYRDYDDHGNQTAKELYDQFKRRNASVLLCYVVSDTNDAKNNGQFMLMRVPKQIADFLRRKIFGWAIKKGENPLPDEMRVGRKAFLMQGGKDLYITVGTEATQAGTFNSYQAEFLEMGTDIPVTQADVNQAGLDLKFDEDFYKPHSTEALEKFLREDMLGMKMEMEVKAPTQVKNTYDPSAANVKEEKPAEAKPQAEQAKQTTQKTNLDSVLSSLGIN